MIWGSWNNKSNATRNLTQWYKAALSEKADLYLCISSSAYILRWLCFFLFKGTTEPECFLEGMMLKLKLQFFGHLMRRTDLLEKIHAGRDWGQKEKGTTEDEMAGGHHWLDGCEFKWTPGVGDGQGGLACSDSWGCKESDTTERLNWTELNFYFRWKNLKMLDNELFRAI